WSEGKSAHSVWMEAAAEVGVPGALALLLFFVIAAAKLWPIARTPQTAQKRYEVAGASSVILAIVGFAVSGQFVSASGLEVPYYTTMVGIGVLKGKRRQVEASGVNSPAYGKWPQPPLTRPAAVAGAAHLQGHASSHD